jgi:membrane protease YdiL (CAAX protease family)
MRKSLLFSVSSVTLWQNSPVHDIRRIAAYFLAVLALGALLAPWLYGGGIWLGGVISPLEFLQRVPFQRYFDRAMLVAAVALLWPLIRSLRVRGWTDLGLAPNARWRRDLAIGFALAAGLLLALGLVFLMTGLYKWRSAWNWSALPNAALSAAAVSLLEESLFRGALLGLVLRSARSWPAQIFVAALYAIVHFLKPPGNSAQLAADLGPIHWLSGFQFLPKVFWQFSEPGLLLGGFVTLFLVGMILGLITQQTRSLWCAIGLHAGWVFGLKTFSAFTAPTRPDLLPWVGQNLLIGLGPLLTVVITAALLRVFIDRRNPELAAAHDG